MRIRQYITGFLILTIAAGMVSCGSSHTVVSNSSTTVPANTNTNTTTTTSGPAALLTANGTSVNGFNPATNNQGPLGLLLSNYLVPSPASSGFTFVNLIAGTQAYLSNSALVMPNDVSVRADIGLLGSSSRDIYLGGTIVVDPQPNATNGFFLRAGFPTGTTTATDANLVFIGLGRNANAGLDARIVYVRPGGASIVLFNRAIAGTSGVTSAVVEAMAAGPIFALQVNGQFITATSTISGLDFGNASGIIPYPSSIMHGFRSGGFQSAITSGAVANIPLGGQPTFYSTSFPGTVGQPLQSPLIMNKGLFVADGSGRAVSVAANSLVSVPTDVSDVGVQANVTATNTLFNYRLMARQVVGFDGLLYNYNGTLRYDLPTNRVVAEIWKTVAGVTTIITSQVVASNINPAGALSFTVIGSRLSLYLNGLQLANATDATIAHGSFGFGGQNMVASTFSAYAPNP